MTRNGNDNESLEQKDSATDEDEEDDAEDQEATEEDWDIDTDPVDVLGADKDSGIGGSTTSEVGSSVCASPIRTGSVIIE